MVQIRQVGMSVRERLMPMRVMMRLRTFIRRMRMLMMFVVNVSVLVLEEVVRVPVLMSFGEHQPRR